MGCSAPRNQRQRTRAALPAGGADGLSMTYVQQRDGGGRKDLRYPAAPEPLAVAVYDNHAHLEIANGPSTGSATPAGAEAQEGLSLADQLARAEALGIAGVVQASGDIESSRWAVQAAASDAHVLAAVAIHPNDAPAYAEQGMLGGVGLDEAITVIDELAAHPRT